MIRFAYPNVYTSGDVSTFIGCGRYWVSEKLEHPPPGYRLMKDFPDTANVSALSKVANLLSRRRRSNLFIYEIEDEHDPDEGYWGDSCSLAFLMARVHRVYPLDWSGCESFDLWFTGTVQFDGGPRLEAVMPYEFNVKLQAFLDSGAQERLFVVPLANILESHEVLCRQAGARILDLDDCRDLTLNELFRERTILRVDFDQLYDLMALFFKAYPLSGRAFLKRHRKALAAVMAVMLLSVAMLWKDFRTSDHTGRAEPAVSGPRLIHEGAFVRAEELLGHLQGSGESYLEGMLALHLNRGEIEKAEALLSKLSNEETSSTPYVWVAKAHLAMSRGRLDEAESAYYQAIDHGLPDWQHAECRLGLGRILMRKGLFQQALESFDRAIRLDPSFINAHIAKGLVLEQMGKPSEALEAYRQATVVNARDPIASTLYRRCEERVKERGDMERKARIDALIQELVDSYRQGPPQPETDREEWGSKPLYLFFADWEARGQPSPREGEDDYLLEEITRRMLGLGRIQLVERARLDRLLEELKLSRTELSDPKARLRLGKVLSARVTAVGTVTRSRGELQITLRAIDTETTLLTAMVSDRCPIDADPAVMIERLTRAFSEQIIASYPLKTDSP